MRSRLVLPSALLFTIAVACTPDSYWKGPVGVSDKAEVASDQSVSLDAGDNYACEHSPELVEGRPCAPEGSVCGGTNSNQHQFSNTLVCRDGSWDREDAPALPSSSSKPASSKKP
jgi:hypothetical protein